MTNSPFRLEENWIPNFCHELQNPVTVILGMIGIILSQYHGPVTDQQRTDLGVLQAQTLFMSRIAKEASCFSKITQPDFQLKKSIHSIQELINHVTRTYQKNIEITLENPDDNLTIDPEFVSFALTTLITNAVLVSGDTPAQLQVKRTQNDVVISIVDFGPVLTPDEVPLLFMPFSAIRARGKTRLSTLGFSLAKQIAEMHGGQVGWEPEFKQGLQLTMRLPI